MSDVARVSPAEAKQLIDESGGQLVASYGSGFQFDAVTIGNAVPIDVFKTMEGDLAKDAEIIFY